MGSLSSIQDFIHAGRLESAWDIMKKNDISVDALDCHKTFRDLERNLGLETADGDIRAVNRLKRRVQALTTFRAFGFVPEKLMSSVDLVEGYHGKILLVHIIGGKADGLVCLRSGDDWHREILQNIREEIQDLGFENSIAVPAGGAWVQFDPDNAIIVYGSSEEFGTCDKEAVADLIDTVFPGRQIVIRHA